MAVIINDFEVVPEAQTQTPAAAETEAVPAAAEALTPQDLYDIMRRHAERMARIRAC